MNKRRPRPQKKSISARLKLEQKTVKSAGRVLEILEYFDDVQRQSTVTEIAEALNYPQSSTSALLRSLVALGYLDNNRHTRTYIPSNRVALLGNWVNSQFVAEGTIISMMKELNDQTGDTIVMCVRNGLHMQYIHVIQATSPARLHLTLGTVRPLVASGAGYAMLSALPDAEVTRLVMRSNAMMNTGAAQVDARELIAQLATVRQKGYAFTCDLVTRGGGIIAALLPRTADQPEIVIGIGGISEVMRSREYQLAAILKQQIESRFGRQQRKDAAPPLRDNGMGGFRVKHTGSRFALS
jgi:DNA-binding IclR family transcriptional regulator